MVRERGSITREVFEARIKSARIKTGQIFDVATREAVQEAVAAGFGIGIVFTSEAGKDTRLKTIPIADQDVSVAEYAICRSERRRLGLVARFIETAHRLAHARWLAFGLDCSCSQGAERTDRADVRHTRQAKWAVASCF